MKKKIVAIILSVLCLTMILPATAFAGSSYTLGFEDPASGQVEMKTGLANAATVKFAVSPQLETGTSVVLYSGGDTTVAEAAKVTDTEYKIIGYKNGSTTIRFVVAAGGTSMVSDIVTLNVTVSDKESYTVTFDANSGTPEPEAQIVEDGGKVTKPVDPTRNGYKFVGWVQGAGSPCWNFETDTVAGNMTLTASWKELEEFDVELSQTEFTYAGSGKGQVPEYTVKDKDGNVLTEDVDFTASVAGGVVSKQINAGEVEIRFTPIGTTKGEYKETIATYTIKPAKLQVTLDKTEFVYNGEEQKPTVTVTGVGGDVLTEGEDYQVTIGQARRVDIGTYSVTVASFNSNYEGAETSYQIVSNNPKTGDSNNMWIYAAIAALALVAMGGVVLRKKAER